MKVEIHIRAEKDEEDLSDAAAVQMLQDALAGLARTPVDELAHLWRNAQRLRRDERLALSEDRHRHRRRKAVSDRVRPAG